MLQEKKHIIITGTTSGLGRVLCGQILSQGFAVTGFARTKINTAFQPTDLYEHIIADLSKLDNVDLVYSEILKKKTRYLIINAADYTPSENLTEEKFLQQLNLNLVFPAALIQKILATKLGYPLKVIFISSIMADIYDGKAPMYGAAKTAISGFIGGLQLQKHPDITFLKVTLGPLDDHKKKSFLAQITSSSFDKTSNIIIDNLTTNRSEIFIPLLWRFIIRFAKITGIKSASKLINNYRP